MPAIHQLELCLAAPFTSLPHSHRHMPQLLQALCDTASFYSFHYDEDDACRLVEVDREVLTIASILPFARLSCSRDGHAMFQPGQYVSIAIPRDVMVRSGGSLFILKDKPSLMLLTLTTLSQL